MATLKRLLALVVLFAAALPAQAFWMPEGFRRAYDNGFQRNYELMTTDYIYETLLIAGLLLYVWNYFSGKRTNRSIAQKWVAANSGLLEKQFSVGINEEHAKEPFKLLDEESANLFKYYATGRVNVKYLMATIELQRRQDFFMMLGLGLLWSHKDRISFEIPFHVANQAPPLCFAIIRKKLKSEIIENYQDLKTMGREYKVEGVSEKLALVTDHQEMIPWFFDRQVKDFLKKFEKSVDIIQVSDRMTFFRTPLALRCTFVLPPNNDSFEASTREQTEFVLRMVEKLLSYQPLPKVRERLDAMRAQYEAAAQQTEEKKKELEEKLRLEKEKKLAAMDPEKRKKLEEQRLKNKVVKKFKLK